MAIDEVPSIFSTIKKVCTHYVFDFDYSIVLVLLETSNNCCFNKIKKRCIE